MPLTRTATDSQRNMSEVSAVCHETGEPVYLTKNGVANLMLMDAAAFEAAMDLRDCAYERERFECICYAEGQKCDPTKGFA